MKKIYTDVLPKKLSEKETQELFKKMNQGDKSARDKIIEHNLRLVIHRINRKFSTLEYEQEELMEIGVIGLIAAVDTFDISKNFKFATYATICIDNQILMFLKKNKKEANTESLEKVIYETGSGEKIILEDTLASDVDLEEMYVESDTNSVIRKIVESLPDREREIIKMRFGFYGDEIFIQNEISKKLNISQPQVSRITNKVLRKIAEELENLGIYEFGSSPLTKGRQLKPDIVVEEETKPSDTKAIEQPTSMKPSLLIEERAASINKSAPTIANETAIENTSDSQPPTLEELIVSFPKALSSKKIQELFEKMNQGDRSARDKIIEHNLRLVTYRTNRRFSNLEYEQEELMEIGILGLIKAVDTFDISKNFKFATYAIRCIDNEILMFVRKNKKESNIDSLEKAVYENGNGEEITLKDTLASDIDLEEAYIEKDTNLIIKNIVESLPDRERKIIKMYFGFGNNKSHHQEEIASVLNISKSYVSRIINRTLKLIAEKLEDAEVFEKGSSPFTKGRQPKPDIVVKEESEDRDIKATQKPEPKTPSTKKTSHPFSSNSSLTKQKNKQQTIKSTSQFFIPNDQTQHQTFPKPNIPEEYHDKNSDTFKGIPATPTDHIIEIAENPITKEGYEKILENLITPIFHEMVHSYPLKERIILTLKLGLVDGKRFSNEAIAEYLQIDTQEVIDVTKEALLAYQEKINQTVNDIIQMISNKTTNYTKKRKLN